MNKLALLSAALRLIAVTCLPAAPAHAAAITWVADAGSSDSNPCTNPAPCQTLTHALSLTDPGGEIRILGQGSFGGVVIKKSVSIISDTSQGGVLAKPSTAAILIQASPTDVINLRGLIIEGAVAGTAGIRFESGAALHVQNSVIRGFQSNAADTGYGIQFITTGTSDLFVSDTLIADNGAIVGNLHIGGGIWIVPNGGSARVALDRVHVEKNIVGINADSRSASAIAVTVWDSVVAGNMDAGIVVTSKGHPNTVVIDRSAVVNNYDVGIQSDGTGSTVYVGNSTISGNATGLRAVNAGVLTSQMNNAVVGNKLNVEEPASTQ